jgi:hypothetical protein
MLSFGYGFLSHWKRIFPYHTIKTVKEAVVSLFSDSLPWYYRKGDYPTQNIVNYNAKSAFAGLNLINSVDWNDSLSVKLIDMRGKIIHKWDIDWFKLWPNPTHLPDFLVPKERPGTHIHGIVLMENGDIIFNFQDRGMIRLNPCCEVVWRLPYITHHSIHRNDQGNFWVSGLKFHERPCEDYPNYEPPFFEHTILEVSTEGQILQEISVMDLLRENGLNGLLYMGSLVSRSTKVSGDTLHLNDVEPFPNNLKEGHFKKDDLMVSLRNINTIFVFSLSDKRIKFLRSGYFVRQHDPDFIDGNTISVLDNNNIAPETHGHQSRILILSASDARTQVYFSGSSDIPFYTDIMGEHQWLPNGNLLITESMKGRAFEIDNQGEIVWEYSNIIKPGITGIVEGVQRIPSHFSTVFTNGKKYIWK